MPNAGSAEAYGFADGSAPSPRRVRHAPELAPIPRAHMLRREPLVCSRRRPSSTTALVMAANGTIISAAATTPHVQLCVSARATSNATRMKTTEGIALPKTIAIRFERLTSRQAYSRQPDVLRARHDVPLLRRHSGTLAQSVVASLDRRVSWPRSRLKRDSTVLGNLVDLSVPSEQGIDLVDRFLGLCFRRDM